MFGEAFINYYNNDERIFEAGFMGLDYAVSGIIQLKTTLRRYFYEKPIMAVYYCVST